MQVEVIKEGFRIQLESEAGLEALLVPVELKGPNQVTATSVAAVEDISQAWVKWCLATVEVTPSSTTQADMCPPR